MLCNTGIGIGYTDISLQHGEALDHDSEAVDHEKVCTIVDSTLTEV